MELHRSIRKSLKLLPVINLIFLIILLIEYSYLTLIIWLFGNFILLLLLVYKKPKIYKFEQDNLLIGKKRINIYDIKSITVSKQLFGLTYIICNCKDNDYERRFFLAADVYLEDIHDICDEISMKVKAVNVRFENDDEYAYEIELNLLKMILDRNSFLIVIFYLMMFLMALLSFIMENNYFLGTLFFGAGLFSIYFYRHIKNLKNSNKTKLDLNKYVAKTHRILLILLGCIIIFIILTKLI